MEESKNEILDVLLRLIVDEIDDNYIDVLLPGYLANRLIDYQSILSDLQLCKTTAQHLQDPNLDETLILSITHAVISLYGKCFTDASHAKKTKLEVKGCFDSSQLALQGTHNKLMELRHNLTAHRGDSGYEYGIAYLKISKEDASIQVRVKQLQKKNILKDDLGLCLQLFDHLINTVKEKVSREGGKAWQHLKSISSPQDLSFLTITKNSI